MTNIQLQLLLAQSLVTLSEVAANLSKIAAQDCTNTPQRKDSGEVTVSWSKYHGTAESAVEPAAVEPAAVEPAAVEPAAVEPEKVVKPARGRKKVEPAVEEPAVEEPAVEEPAVEEPAEEPAVEEPAVEEPAEEKESVGSHPIKGLSLDSSRTLIAKMLTIGINRNLFTRADVSKFTVEHYGTEGISTMTIEQRIHFYDNFLEPHNL